MAILQASWMTESNSGSDVDFKFQTKGSNPPLGYPDSPKSAGISSGPPREVRHQTENKAEPAYKPI